MAFEKECDEILTYLERRRSNTHIIEIYRYLLSQNIQLTEIHLIKCLTILASNNHIREIQEVSVSSEIVGTKQRIEFLGVVCISLSGAHFAITSSYTAKKQQDELQIEISKSNLLMADLGKKQYVLNLIVGVAAILGGVYAVFQLFDYYNHHTVNWVYAAYFLTGFAVGLLLLQLLMQLKKIMHKKQ